MITEASKYGLKATVKGDATKTLARATLGLTLYLEDPGAWSHGGAAKVLSEFLKLLPPGMLRHYTTSTSTHWFRLEPGQYDDLVTLLSTPWSQGGVRHLWSVQVVDDIGAAQASFVYREIDSDRESRKGYLQLTFPACTDATALLQLVWLIASEHPYWCGVAGHLATWNPWEKPTAFWAQYRWSKRFLGLDIQDADAMAWRVGDGLPSTNWLTLMGKGFMEKLEVDAEELKAHAWERQIEVHELGQGLLVRAGAGPTLGDVNQLKYPSTYAEVGRRLRPWLVKDPPRFHGGFWEGDDVGKWIHRFDDPEMWL